MRRALSMSLGIAMGAALLAPVSLAQAPRPTPNDTTPLSTSHGAGTEPGHAAHTHHAVPGATGVPTAPGQDAFGAIAEVVALLDADPATDWSRVDLERLRQHLVDMNEVVLRASVKQRHVPGGLVMEITGRGRTEAAIRAMVIPHTRELDRIPAYSALAEVARGGVRLTVTAKDTTDAAAVARIRGLGFIGLLTIGAHHQPHHLAMARGDGLSAHSR